MKIIHESGLSIDTKNLDLQSNMTRGQDDNYYIYYVPDVIPPFPARDEVESQSNFNLTSKSRLIF